MKKLVIGILNCNRGIEISLLMQSLLNQTYQDFDIIIIDDNSNDFLYDNSTFGSLLKLHENLNHKVKIIKGQQKGPHFAGQLLFENSSDYNFVCRLDDDITVQPEFLEKLINCFDDKNVVAVGPIYLLPFKNISEQIIDLNSISDYNKKIMTTVQLVNDNEIYVNGAFQMNILLNSKGNIETQHLHSGFMYRRLSLKNIDGYFLGYSKTGHREETDTSYRLFLNGGKLLICSEAVAFHFHPMFGGIRTDSSGKPNDTKLWENDEKIFINRFKNNFHMDEKFEEPETINQLRRKLEVEPIRSMNEIIELKKRPPIHLVTVTHGSHEKLEKLIESVKQYTEKPFTWTIVNNDISEKSYNRLIEIIETYNSDIDIIHEQLDREVSVSEARNIGARVRPAESEYICFIDDDALVLGNWGKSWLTMMYETLVSEKDIGAVSPIYTWFDPLQSYVLSVACLMTSVKVWRQVGGLDPVFGNKAKGTWGYEDTDWSYRLQSMGYKIKGVGSENFPFYHEDTTIKEKAEWQKSGLLKAKKLLLIKHGVEKFEVRTKYPFTKEQLEIPGKKLNVGSYYMYLDGFTNIDVNPDCKPDIVGDIRDINFDDDSISLILASQVIEHFDLPDVEIIISNFYKWLKPGGFLVVEVPDVGKIMDLVENEKRDIKDYYGAIYGNNEVMGQKHKSQFDEKLLRGILEKQGFKHIIRNMNTSDNDEITLKLDVIK